MTLLRVRSPAGMCGVIACAFLLSACADDATEDAPPLVVRDSAGVRIIENHAPEWADGEAWRLGELLMAIEADETALEQRPLDPASVFRTARGEIVVGDGLSAGWHRLLVYDGRGRFLRHISRRGEGPCEFGQLWWARPYGIDSVAVFDMARNVIHVLGLDGGCGRSVRIPPGELPAGRGRAGIFTSGADAVYPDGSFLAWHLGYLDAPPQPGPAWFRHTLIRISADGTAVDTLGEFRIGQSYWDGERAGRMGYPRWAYRALHGADLLYGDGDSFEFTRHDGAGRPREIVRRRYSPAAIIQEDRIAFVQPIRVAGGHERAVLPAATLTLEQRIARVHWPQTKPAISNLVVAANGDTWVEEYRYRRPGALPGEPPPAVWSVFSPEGRWLGGIDVPGRLELQTVHDDAVFGIWRDDDGVGSIRAYALVKGRES